MASKPVIFAEVGKAFTGDCTCEKRQNHEFSNSNNNDNDNNNNDRLSTTQSKPMYENNHMTAFWDVPVYADQTEVRATSLDARRVDRERRRKTLLEMGCCWVENYQRKEEEKTLKYAPLCMELTRQHPGFEII